MWWADSEAALRWNILMWGRKSRRNPEALISALKKRWPEKPVQRVGADAACRKRSGPPRTSRTTLGVPPACTVKTPLYSPPSPSPTVSHPRRLVPVCCPSLQGDISRGTGKALRGGGGVRLPVSRNLNDQNLGWSLTPGPDRTGMRFICSSDCSVADCRTGACCICRLLWNDIVGRGRKASSYRWQALHKIAALHAPRRHRFVLQVSWMDGEGVATEP